MNATALSLHTTSALAACLRGHGWDAAEAASAASGLGPLAVHLQGVESSTREALLRFTAAHGLDFLSGSGWAIVAGARSRLAALARPSQVGMELVAVAVAVGDALPALLSHGWRTTHGVIPLERPLLVGILNLTPDSFSDGDRLRTADDALRQAERLVADGAGMLDLGGESTRPGRDAEVPAEEEVRRILPVIERLVRELPAIPVAVDTVKATVADVALSAGASVVNDVSMLRLDSAMAAVVARHRAGLVVTHSRGTNLRLSSYDQVDYGDDLVGSVIGELRGAITVAERAGVASDAIVVDPGLGFSKTPVQSLQLLDQLSALACLGRPIYVGPSRKRFLGEVSGRVVSERDELTAVACALAVERGAQILRIHEIRAVRDAVALTIALQDH